MDTLVTVINRLEAKGFTAQFYPNEDHFKTSKNDHSYRPEQLEILERHRFEGMSNPADSSELYAIKADDGTKGTLVYSYTAKKSCNPALIQAIPLSEGVIP